jgi:hypothetical protein
MTHTLTLDFTYESYLTNKTEIDALLKAMKCPLDGYPFLGLKLELEVNIKEPDPDPVPEQMWEFYERNPILKAWDRSIVKKLANWLYHERGCHLSEDVGVHVRHDLAAKPLPEYTCFEIIA